MAFRRGFTLIEILITIGILLLLLGGTLALSFPYLEQQQLHADGEITASEVRQAQAEAYAQDDDAGHGLKVFTDHLVRFEGASYAARVVAKDKTTTLPGPVDSLPQASEIDFAAGSLNPGAVTTIRLVRDTFFYDISLSAYGVLTIQEGSIAP